MQSAATKTMPNVWLRKPEHNRWALSFEICCVTISCVAALCCCDLPAYRTSWDVSLQVGLRPRALIRLVPANGVMDPQFFNRLICSKYRYFRLSTERHSSYSPDPAVGGTLGYAAHGKIFILDKGPAQRVDAEIEK